MTAEQINAKHKGDNFYKHGLSNTKLHRVWWGIVERCYKRNHKSFKEYGGRGIAICDEWRADFRNFYDWAIANGYKEGLTIDRINNDGNYEPSNCRWVSQSENARNRRTARIIEFNGVKHSLIEWAEITGLNPDTITERLKTGWSVSEALTIKKNGRYKKHERGGNK